MFLSPQETADKFGITVEKLERMSKRKDCPADFVDENGCYNEEKVGKMLDFLQKQAEYTKKYHAAKRAESAEGTPQTRAAKKSKTQKKHYVSTPAASSESYDEFVMRFWETDEMWRDFVTAEVNENWLRYFLNAALEFGYQTAHPEQ